MATRDRTQEFHPRGAATMMDLLQMINHSHQSSRARVGTLFWRHAAVSVGVPEQDVVEAGMIVFSMLDRKMVPLDAVPVPEHDNEICSLCLQSSQGGIYLPCKHAFHWTPTEECVGLQHWNPETCPKCRRSYHIPCTFPSSSKKIQIS